MRALGWPDRASAAGRASQPAAGAPDPVGSVEGGDGEDAAAVVVAHGGLTPELVAADVASTSY